MGAGEDASTHSRPSAAPRPTTLGPNPRLAATSGGGGRIRTFGAVSSTAVFKTAALSRSATPPAIQFRRVRQLEPARRGGSLRLPR